MRASIILLACLASFDVLLTGKVVRAAAPTLANAVLEAREFSGVLAVSSTALPNVTKAGGWERVLVPWVGIDGVLHSLSLANGRVGAAPQHLLASPGQTVAVNGRKDSAGSAIVVDSWDDVRLTNAPGRRLGTATGPVSEMLTLWLNIRQCGEGANAEAVKAQWYPIRETWGGCSTPDKFFKAARAVMVDVEVPCEISRDCEGGLEQQRQHALAVAAAQGIDPNTFPVHVYTWPQWVSASCFPGQSYIGCYGHEGFECRSEIAEPWTTDIGTVLHELGHALGNNEGGSAPGSCARAKAPPEADCGEGPYGDQTTPMGSNLSPGCFNLAQQHIIGWTHPELLAEAQLPFGQWYSTALTLLTRSMKAGTRVYLPGSHAIYLDYIRNERGRKGFPAWVDNKVAIYSMDWDGVTWTPNTAPFVYFEGMLAWDGDCLVLDQGHAPLPNLKLCRSASDGKTATVGICRFAGSPDECV